MPRMTQPATKILYVSYFIALSTLHKNILSLRIIHRIRKPCSAKSNINLAPPHGMKDSLLAHITPNTKLKPKLVQFTQTDHSLDILASINTDMNKSLYVQQTLMSFSEPAKILRIQNNFKHYSQNITIHQIYGD